MAAKLNGAVVRRAIDEIWNQGTLETADALFAPAYINHGGLIPDLVRGPEAIKVGVALYRTAFPDFQVVVDDLIAEGETVVLHWTARSEPPGVRADVGATGPRGQVTGVTRVRLVGGQIAESWTRWDRAGVLAHLGIIPPTEAV
jgi:predicted SnoaL-like aldol condensation-catalyzing enzyme